MRGIRPWLFSGLLLALVGYVVFSSPTFQGCEQKEQGRFASQQLSIGISEFVKISRVCTGEFVYANANSTIAVFTVVLALATIFLWTATRDLVHGAERTERRQLRAYVGVDRLSFECAGFDDKNYKPSDLTTPGLVHQDFLVVKVRNYGQTPAYDVTVFGYIAATNYPNRLPDDFFEKNDTDNISMAEVRVTLARFLLHKDQMEFSKHALPDITSLIEAKAKKKQAYIFGRIYYRDIYGRPWRTKFCYSWEPWHSAGERFVAYEQYNGEDQATLEEWPPRPLPQS